MASEQSYSGTLISLGGVRGAIGRRLVGTNKVMGPADAVLLDENNKRLWALVQNGDPSDNASICLDDGTAASNWITLEPYDVLIINEDLPHTGKVIAKAGGGSPLYYYEMSLR